MEVTDQSPEEVYSVWALPLEPVHEWFPGVMAGLRAAHGGPTFEPHATVVGAIRLLRFTAIEALHTAIVICSMCHMASFRTAFAASSLQWQPADKDATVAAKLAL
ncbi:hypothetical protein E2562_038507 [Oryza meyeriana var. granulata]|uniref:Uncharacterized protein n=1 Tax=Oryza meyeriana var. granulata TaxID=110450 RepID=A0A6G1CBD0_9ORYZ|nr:hypothetical protein E2562_038507 [Oryza meyeriana var. granulata]